MPEFKFILVIIIAVVVLLIAAVIITIMFKKKKKINIDEEYVRTLLSLLGGKSNISSIGIEGRKLKVVVNDLSIVDLDSIKNIGIVIGPEGGFEEEEIEKLKEQGAYIITLGNRILRTETAGFTATALVQYELSDLGGTLA